MTTPALNHLDLLDPNTLEDLRMNAQKVLAAGPAGSLAIHPRVLLALVDAAEDALGDVADLTAVQDERDSLRDEVKELERELELVEQEVMNLTRQIEDGDAAY